MSLLFLACSWGCLVLFYHVCGVELFLLFFLGLISFRACFHLELSCELLSYSSLFIYMLLLFVVTTSPCHDWVIARLLPSLDVVAIS